MKDKKELDFSFYYDYAKKTHKRNRILKNTMIFLCSLAIAFSAIVYNFGDAYILEQEKLLNEISNTEIFVVNKTTPLKVPLDMDENLSISPNELESIGKINEIAQVYPFFEFRSSGYDIELDIGITQCKLKITQNGMSEEYSFDSNNGDEFDVFSIMPYYPEQKLEKRLGGSGNVENGIYISTQLAEILNIHDTGNGIMLNIDIYVPVMLYDTIMSAGKENSEYNIDIDISKKVNLEFQIEGILNSNVRNTYTTSGENIIYVPYSIMKGILDNNHNLIDDQAYKEWYPSAYVVFAKSYNDIQSIISKITAINPNFQTVSSYQDINSMNRMIEATRNTGRWITAVILAIIFLLMSIIYLNNTMKRKYEISLLKANGMTRTELFKLVMVESARHVIFVTLISTVISLALIWIINFLFSFNVINISISIIIHNILVSMLSILIPTIIAIVAINRFKPDRVMRN